MEEFIDFIVCSGNSFPCNEFECEIIEDAINGKYDLYAFMEKGVIDDLLQQRVMELVHYMNI